ncbi:MAG: DUF6055 domain-containing protein [Bacteroidales bacterium]
MRFDQRIICLLFLLSVTGLLPAQENIALKATEINTSHVSDWETLEAINSGYDPVSSSDKSHGAYGNWTGNDAGVWNWVEYVWDSLYIIDRSEIYWWTDGGGIQIPDASRIEYYDMQADEWKMVPNHSGFVHEKDRYSVVTFDPVLTNRLRYYMMSTVQATGILQWKVYGIPGEQDMYHSSVELSEPLAPAVSSTITVTALHETEGVKPDYVFKLDVHVINEYGAPDGHDEQYVVNGEVITSTTEGLILPPTGADGKVSFDVAMPPGIDPGDGVEVQVKYQDGVVAIDTFGYSEPLLNAPALVAAATNHSVEDQIVIAFDDDSDWREKVTRVTAGGTELESGVDYELNPGELVLIPAGGNPALTASGTKQVRVEATCYNDAVVYQEILPGPVDAGASRAETLAGMFRGTRTSIRVLASDRYGNGISDYVCRYDIEITDNQPANAETYRVAGMEVTESLSGLEMPATGGTGESSVSLAIPPVVDLDDGIRLIFRLEDGAAFDTVSYYYTEEEKEVHIQYAVRTHNDFSWDRTAQSGNFIIFWGANITGDPRNQELNGDLWFDPEAILEYSEAFYAYVSDTMKFLNADGSHASRYKFEIVMNETWTDQFTGWAFGGPVDNTTGGVWIHPGATRGPAVLVHETGHACQGMVSIDKPGYGIHAPYGGFFWESHTEWMKSVYLNDRSGFFPRYIMTSMMHYSTTRRHYQNFAFLDYVADRYGIQAVNDIWHLANSNTDHPLTSFRDSVMRYTQDDLNDDFLKSAMSNVTWDTFMQEPTREALAGVPEWDLWRMHTILDTLGGEPGWFIVPQYLAPGDYGYNIIPLYPEEGASQIEVAFNGLPNEPAGGAGSRYGFVAVGVDQSVRYSEVYTEEDTETLFTLQPGDSMVYLVVTGAPPVHHNYEWEVGYTKNYRYPYTVHFTGAFPAGHKEGYNSRREEHPGAPHPNGGGWVASTAYASSTAWVGPHAQVLENARVEGTARIEGYAVVMGNATVRNSAVVKDHVLVTGNSVIENTALAEKTAMVYHSNLKDEAVVTGSAMVKNSTLSGNAVAKDLACLDGKNLSGTAVVGGDAEDYNNISEGTYLDITRASDPDGKICHERNDEVNPWWPEYAYPMGPAPSKPLNLQAEEVGTAYVILGWDASECLSGEVDYYVMKKSGDSFEVIGTAEDNRFTVEGLQESTGYTFRVQAKTRSGILSQPGNELSVVTGATDVATVDEAEGNLRFSPNPVKDEVLIETGMEKEAVMVVYDMGGRIVLETTFTRSVRIRRNELGTPGLYCVIVSDGVDKYTGKLIVK